MKKKKIEKTSDRDEDLLALLREDIRDSARSSLCAFAAYFLGERFSITWFGKKICALLDEALKKNVRVIIQLPPRHGKTLLVSHLFPAYALGRFPDLEIIAGAYSAALAKSYCRAVQRVIDSSEYREIFPDTVLANTREEGTRTAEYFEISGRSGKYRCAGVGGGITGHGAQLILVDDPIKNWEEAYSRTYRDRVWEWYCSTLYTRLCGTPRSIVLVLTRWHQDDLAGRLIEKAREEKADKWLVFSLPAIHEGPPTDLDPREEGDPLWPENFGLDELEKIRASVTPTVWASLYQQRPQIEGGGIIKIAWLRYYDELPRGDGFWIQSWDLSFEKTSDGSFVVGQVWFRQGARFYLVDQIRARLSFVETLEAIRELTARYPQAIKKIVEKKANGAAVLDFLDGKISGLCPSEPRGGKEDRLRAVSALFFAGNVYLPKREKSPWIDDFVDELIAFPAHPHDDQVDAASQALLALNESISSGGYLSIEKKICAQLPRGSGFL